MRRDTLLSLTAAAALLTLPACGEGLDPAVGPEGEVDPAASASLPTNYKGLAVDGRAHIKPWRDPRAAASLINTAVTANLKYYGGHVISNVRVIAVYWGPNVNSTITSGIGGFYSAVVNSPYIDWLSEYNTNITAVGGQAGTNQTIGRGTYGGAVTITPSVTATSITDAQIQSELNKQITSGALPAPDANTLFMVHFPKGVTIDQGGSKSCQGGGFCAYHGTMKVGANNRYYAVMPDFSAGSGCDTGCGTGTMFNNVTTTAAHELIEAITDAEVGMASTYGPPLAWYDQAGGEIGDICNGESKALPGTSYFVQTEWSNKANACIVVPGAVTPTPTVSLSAPAAGATLSGTAIVSANASESGGTIASVSFYANGQLLGTDTTSPYSYSWNTAAVANGAFSLTATATDSAGKTASSSAVAVTVSNGGSGGGAKEAEPNNATTTANAISSGVATTGTISASSDVDYFKITLPAGKSLKVTLKVPANADYDLYVYNSNATLVGSGTAATGVTESVTISNTGTSAFTRYLKVAYYSGATAGAAATPTYTLTATIQ